VGSGELRSLFGGAEKLEANVSYGTKHKLSFSAAYKCVSSLPNGIFPVVS